MSLAHAVLLTLAVAVTQPAHARVREFPHDFRFCVATAAHQIEGGNTESDWWDWEHLPPSCDESGCKCKVRNCEVSGPTADHWNRVEGDIRLLEDLGVRDYRMSVEWAKLEPKQGEWNWDATWHYQSEIKLLREAGIRPMITLHHFTMPRWLRELGGWEWEGAPQAFARFAEFVYLQLGAGVTDWVTVNEPLVHLGGGYALGLTPPGVGESEFLSVGTSSRSRVRASSSSACGPLPSYSIGRSPTKKDIERVISPARGLLKSHAAAYHRLHELARKRNHVIRVGMAHHLRVFDPKVWISPLDHLIAGVLDDLWNWSMPDALSTGVMRFEIPFMLKHEETIPGLKGTQDFFGVNYYSRDIVSFKWDGGPAIGMETRAGAPTSDLGWEIYPLGLYRVLIAAHERYFGIPLMVTENGLADCDDSQRPTFIREHLRALHKVIELGVKVETYCHWSAIDNFEWVEGFAPRFGLYEVDYVTQQRRPRPSARFFSDTARSGRFDDGR